MKNILMYTNDKIYTTKRMTGGIKRFKMLYDGLVKSGYNVTLYCGESKEDLVKYNDKACSVYRDEKKTKLFASVRIFLKNRKMIRKLKKDNYDDVIVFDVPTAVGLCIQRLRNINLFMRQDLIEYRKIILQEKNRNRLYSFLYLQIMKYCEYICCKTAKKIIVQCNYDLNNLISRHKCISENIKNKSFIQINNINVPWIVDKFSINTSNKKQNNSVFTIGFIGDFSGTRKGHDIFLSAVKELIDNKYNIKALVVGDGKLLEQECDKYKDYKNIKFLGRLNDISDIMNQVDLIVVPSRADSCPNTVLESLYNKVLVIGSNAGGIPEILDDKDMLFELDASSLEDKIIELYDDNRKYNNLLERQDKIRKRLSFDWVEKMINILCRGVNDVE